ncbi:MAG: hypothetical protein ABSG96_24955 [Terracidiphilus sp.]
MTRTQVHNSGDRRPKTKALVVASVVCLLLVALLAVLQVMHSHAVESDADHCPLCIAMHSVVPVVAMVAAAILVRLGRTSPVLVQTRVALRYWHPTLFTRPPPAAC